MSSKLTKGNNTLVSACACLCLFASVCVCLCVSAYVSARMCLYTCACVRVLVCARGQKKRKQGKGWRACYSRTLDKLGINVLDLVCQCVAGNPTNLPATVLQFQPHRPLLPVLPCSNKTARITRHAMTSSIRQMCATMP